MNAWLPAAATVFSAIIGSFLGSFVYGMWQDKRKKKRVEQAIKTELQNSGDISKVSNVVKVLGNRIDQIEDENLPEIELEILDSNLDSIGLLDEGVAEDLTMLKSNIRHYDYLRNSIDSNGWNATTADGSCLKENMAGTIGSIVDIKEKIVEELES